MNIGEIKYLFESICPGESVFNSTELWDSSAPVFNRCFQQTVPVWLPTIFLWIIASYQLKTFWSQKETKSKEVPFSIAFNVLNVSKLVASLLIVASSAVQLLDKSALHSPADLSYYLLNVFNFTLLAFLINLHRHYGVHSSALVWSFTLLSAILSLPRLYMFAFFGQQSPEVHYPSFGYQSTSELISFAIHFISLWTLHVLTCFADNFSFKEEDDHPLNRASFLSMLTYWWVNPLMLVGYRKTLSLSDIWPIRAEDATKTIGPTFDRYWKQLKEENRENGKASLLWAIACTFKADFILGGIGELMVTVFVFTGPQLVKHFLRFISSNSSSSEPLWHGYLLAVLIFTSSLCLSIFRNFIDHIMFSLRMRIRTALVSAIYRKSLVLNISSTGISTGEMINLQASDTWNIMLIIAEIHSLWSAPLMLVLAIYFLWQELGMALLAGIIVMAALVPFTMWISNREQVFREAQMVAQDERLKLTAEVLAGARIIKFFGWEIAFARKIEDIRDKEVKQIENKANQNAITSIVWSSAPILVTLASFAAYILFSGDSDDHILDPPKAFVCLALFEELRFPMTHLPDFLSKMVTTLVSVRRIETFLHAEELQRYVSRDADKEAAVRITDNAIFAWKKSNQKMPEESVLSDINLQIKRGALVAIVGQVGSGKSSLLSAIIGDLELLTGSVNISEEQKIAYVAQQAWICNASLRDNILFGETYDEARYWKIIEYCALGPDLAALPAGDQTEIGEKGINLSGGQKQRVALARACYSNASLYILDDPLSAVDSHVSKHLFEKVISSTTGCLKETTRLLVTNNIAILPEVDQIIVLEGGRIRESGMYSELMANSGQFADFIKEHSSDDGREEEKVDLTSTRFNTSRQNSTHLSESSPISLENQKDSTNGQLIKAEHIESGRVSAAIFLTYFRACTWFYVTIFVLGYSATELFSVGSDVWLAKWANEAVINGTYEEAKVELVARQTYRLAGYSLFALTQTFCIFIGAFALAKTHVNCSSSLHQRLLQQVMRSPISFFESTPIGRILNRFAKDIGDVDTDMSFNLDDVVTNILQLTSNLVLICVHIPVFILAILPISYLYYVIQTFFTSTYRQLNRLKMIYKSPIFSHFGETLSGVSTIRAFGHASRFISEAALKADTLSRAYYATLIINRWMALRLELLGNVLVLLAAAFALTARQKGFLEPGFVGLIVSYSLGMIRSLNDLVRVSSDFEKNLMAVERIDEYCHLEEERPWIRQIKKDDNVVPDGWPARGRIQFTDFCIRYRPGLELVLKNLNLTIVAGEKVGVCGRTGSGKSTLTLALFGMLEPVAGSIIIDGVDIAKIGLHELRHRMAIIPQDPILFSGSIRSNLDPFELHTDEQLLEALAQCHLLSFVGSTELGLSHPITEGGGNLSVGQRQLLCLGRALLRRTQIVVLDEATAAIDLETDALIQETIRKEFSSCTVITIAHRLNTVVLDCDRVLVLDAGNVLEFDSPYTLLKGKGAFYELCQKTGPSMYARLYQLARETYQRKNV